MLHLLLYLTNATDEQPRYPSFRLWLLRIGGCRAAAVGKEAVSHCGQLSSYNYMLNTDNNS